MVAAPILAAIASFLTFAAIADPSQFTPGAIFSAVALFGILRPPIEELPHAMVEVGDLSVTLHLRISVIWAALHMHDVTSHNLTDERHAGAPAVEWYPQNCTTVLVTKFSRACSECCQDPWF